LLLEKGSKFEELPALAVFWRVVTAVGRTRTSKKWVVPAAMVPMPQVTVDAPLKEQNPCAGNVGNAEMNWTLPGRASNIVTFEAAEGPKLWTAIV